jgi:Kef-type K+ transport system membrane component KefB
MTDPEVQLLLFDLALIIVLARVMGAAAKRIGQPAVIGEILAGLLLGPTIWGTHVVATLFPLTLIPPLTALADLGLALFMFVVGFEVDLGLVRGRERVAASVAIGSIVGPLVLGTALGGWLAHEHHVTDPAAFVLFFGTAMSITAFPVLARILTDRGLHRTRIGGLALASASVDDVLAWALLAVVIAVTGASAGHSQLRLILAPVYAVVMIWLVRPLLKRLAGLYQRQGQLTPAMLAAVLALLLLSAAATDWMGVKFIFGAFIFGIVMPRDVPALRTAVLSRLEQVSVLVLLPVFFVIAGINVNLRTVGLSGLADLGLIMVVAVAGKFGGAYYAARFAGVRRRQAGALAALMNTRGLTELVVLAIGLQLGILTQSLYSLMVVMAIVTTAMAGPLLKLIYPPAMMERDIAEADRAGLGAAAHRIAVLVTDLATAGPLVDLGTALAMSRSGSELVLSHLVPHQPGPASGGGVGAELLEMTQTMRALAELTERAQDRGVTALVQSRFSDDIGSEMSVYVNAAEPQAIVLAAGAGPADALGVGGATQLVAAQRPLPAAPTAVAARWVRGADGDAAVQVAAELAAAKGLDLVLTPGGRPAESLAADLVRRGISVSAGTHPPGAILVGTAGPDSGDLHLIVTAGTREPSDDMDAWTAELVHAGRQADEAATESRQA